MQFIDPPTQGSPYPTLNNVGICRIAFTVDDIDKTYEELKSKKVDFLAPLKKIEGPGGSKIGVVCFKDPDGTILELDQRDVTINDRAGVEEQDAGESANRGRNHECVLP